MANTKQSSAAKRSSSGPPPRGRAATRHVPPTEGRREEARAGQAQGVDASDAATSSSNGVPATIKQVANTAKRPAIAVGAAAAGVAGGLVLRSRTRRKTVLGLTVPRSVGKTLSGLDAKSVAKTVGQASKQFAKTTKNVSKDLERAGDQAERIGKILD